MRCTYKASVTRVRVTTVVVEKRYKLHILSVCVCVCSPSYSARKAHTPYYHLWQVWLYIFPHYGTIFGKPLLNIKCVFCYSLQALSPPFIILRRIQRDIKKIHTGLYVKYPLLLSDHNKT